jgi:hypothetical protein
MQPGACLPVSWRRTDFGQAEPHNPATLVLSWWVAGGLGHLDGKLTGYGHTGRMKRMIHPITVYMYEN